MYETRYHNTDLKNISFLVTGGAGFIGSHIVEYLLKHGAGKVRVLDDLSTGNQQNIDLFIHHPAYEFQFGDIRKTADCKKACDGINLISHQAAIGSVPRSVKDPVTTNDVNCGGFVNLVYAAKEAKCRRIIFASSSSVYGDDTHMPKTEEKTGNPLSPYAVSKKSMELYAAVFSKVFAMEITGLRYFNVFGPRQDPNGPYAAVIPLFINSLLNNRPVDIHDDGLQTRDFTFVENVVQANMMAMLSQSPSSVNKIYNIGVGGSFSIIDLFEALCKITGREVTKNFTPQREGDVRNSSASVALAKQFLQYNPKIDFNSGLKMTCDYFIANQKTL